MNTDPTYVLTQRQRRALSTDTPRGESARRCLLAARMFLVGATRREAAYISGLLLQKTGTVAGSMGVPKEQEDSEREQRAAMCAELGQVLAREVLLGGSALGALNGFIAKQTDDTPALRALLRLRLVEGGAPIAERMKLGPVTWGRKVEPAPISEVSG